MNPLRFWRGTVNRVMLGLTALCALATVSLMFFILSYLVWHGARAIDWAFFTQLPKPAGDPGGGLANALLGSAKLLTLAAALGVPVGFAGGVYLAEFGGRPMAFVVRYTADLLNGVPSIVIGIFAYVLVVMPMKHFSTLAGGFALALMIVPVTLRSTEQFLRAVPLAQREAALALGAGKWQTVATIAIPSAARGILTGTMLGIARVAGETAPLLFTSFSNRYWSHGWNQPIASLPVMIFTYAISPYEDWRRQAWAAGLVLLALVVLTNVAARLLFTPRSPQRMGS